MLGLSTLVTTCGDHGVTGPDIGLASAGFDLTGLARAGGSLPIPVDTLRVTLRRSSDNSIVVDTSIYINSSAVRTNQDTIAITLRIGLKETPESFQFLVQARGGGIAYYEVSGNVSVEANGISRTPDMVPTYVGPGAAADSVTVTLAPSAIAGGDSALVWSRVWDGDTVVPGVPVGYRSSDTLKLNQIRYVGVDSAWVHAPLALTDSVDIIAVTPTGLSQSRRLSFAPPPTQLVISSGDGQSVPAGTPAGSPLVVELRDAAGNPYPIPREIVFAVVSGSGTVAPLQDTTNAAGQAQTTFTAGGSSGPVQVSATATGITGAAVTFNATVTGGGGPGAPDTVVIISGNNQTAANGTQLPAALVVEIRDQVGIPVPGVTVDWSPVQGSAAPTTGVTDGAGRAQTNWTLGTNTASQSLTATVAGLTPQTFHATATFASPTILLSFTGVPGVGIGLSTNLNVGLSAPAGAGGVTVTVTSDAPGTVSVGGSGQVAIPQGQSSGVIPINGVSLGTTTIRGNATGFTEGTLSVDVQDRSISLPTTLNVPYGQTASLPIQLASPAPPGGVTFSVTSSNTNFVGLSAPTVFIAAGALTANVTLQGILPGPSTITVSNPSYVDGISTVTTTASLNIVQGSALLNASFGTGITINFESNNSGIAAPAPGIAVNLTAANSACLAVTSPVTISTGLVSTTATLTYGGSATLPCSTQLLATATNLQPDSIPVTVNPIPALTLNGLSATGSGLMTSSTVFLGASNHGGVTVTVKSSNPAVALVSPNATTPGTDSIQVNVLNGSTSLNYYAQAVEGQVGSATITASAPGFSNGTASFTVVQPAAEVVGLPSSTTSLSSDSPFYLQVGVPNGQNTGLSYVQNVRPGIAGGGLTATFVSDTPAVGTLVNLNGTAATRTATIVPGLYYTPTTVASGGVAFHPVSTGVTTVTGTVSGFIQVTTATRAVTVTQPGLTVGGLNITGGGLMTSGSVFLGAGNHGGVTVTVKSSNPAVALVSPNSTTPGSDSIQVQVLNTNTSFSYFVQGVEGQTGSATVTASAPGFSNGSTSISIVTPGIEIQGIPTATTSLSADNPFYAQIGVPNGQNTGLSYVQNVRPGVSGGGIVATFVTDTPSVGILVDSTGAAATRSAVIPPGLYYSPTTVASGGVAFHPLTTGTTFTSVSSPGVLTMTTTGVRRTDVTQPAINLNGLPVTGAGLMAGTNLFLGASNHGGVTVTVKSSNPGLVTIAPNATTPGTDSIQVFVNNGTTSLSFFVQGIEGQAGNTTVTARAAGFSPDTAAIVIVQPGVEIQGLPTSTTTLSPDNLFYAQVGVPNGQNTGLSYVQNVRAGIPGDSLTVTMVNSVPAIATLVKQSGSGSTQTVKIPSGLYYSSTTLSGGGVQFHPILAGSTTVTSDIPGFLRMTSTGNRTVAVTQPGISVGGINPTGSGLMTGANVSLGASNHGGVTVTIKSSNAAVVRVAPNATTPGTDSIQVFVPNNSTSVGYYVQGLEGQTGTVAITASASGFTNGSNNVTIVTPGIEVQGLPASTTTLSSDIPFYAQVGVPNGQNTGLSYVQNLRAGFTGGSLLVTFVSDTPAVGTLVDTLGSGATRTARVPEGLYYTPTSLAAGGVTFAPLSLGSTFVHASAPGFTLMTSTGTRRVDVTQPAISISNFSATGSALMTTGSVSLNATQHGGAVIKIKSSNPAVARVSPNSTTPGTDSIMVNIAAGGSNIGFYVQGIEGQTGNATISASEPRFIGDQSGISIVQPMVEIQALVSSIQAGAPDNPFYAQIGVPNAQQSGLSYVQNLRPGLNGDSLAVALQSSTPGAATLVTTAGTGATRTVYIQPGLYYSPTAIAQGGVGLRPLAQGTTTVSVTAPGFLQAIINGVRQVTITP